MIASEDPTAVNPARNNRKVTTSLQRQSLTSISPETAPGDFASFATLNDISISSPTATTKRDHHRRPFLLRLGLPRHPSSGMNGDLLTLEVISEIVFYSSSRPPYGEFAAMTMTGLPSHLFPS